MYLYLGHTLRALFFVTLGCVNFISMVCLSTGQQWHTHNRFMALFLGPPGWAGARRNLLLDFMVQGKINRGRHTDHPAGCHSVRTNQWPTSIIPPCITSKNLIIYYSINNPFDGTLSRTSWLSQYQKKIRSLPIVVGIIHCYGCPM